MKEFSDLTSTHEADLVRAVFADRILRDSVGMPPSIRGLIDYRLRVFPHDLGVAPGSFGDIDAIVIEGSSPDRAAVIEFKRVKITPDSFRTRLLNKLNEIKKGVDQANALARVGFAQVWLTVIVVADVRPITVGTGFSFAPHSMMQAVENAFPMSDLAADVGVTVREICQVSDQPADIRGTAGGRILRNASNRKQSRELSTAVEELFSRPFDRPLMTPDGVVVR